MSCGKDRCARPANIHSNCVAEIVNHINDMQEAIQEDDLCPTGCMNPLGVSNMTHSPVVNTRPIMLYSKEGFPLAIYTNVKTGQTTQLGAECSTQLFRVESVDGNCATLRGLVIEAVERNRDGKDDGKNNNNNKNNKNQYVDICTALESPYNYGLKGTNACVTVNLDCFCSIQCLNTLDDYVAPRF